MARTKLLLPAITVIAMTMVTACGSTVQTVDSSALTPSDALAVPGSTPPSAAADGLSAPALGGSATASGPVVTNSGTAAVAAGTTRSGLTPSGSAPITSGGGSTGLTPSRSPGVTATKVYMGIPYSAQSASADRAIGASGAAPSYDTRNVVNAVIDYANKHGGFAGRQLEPLYYNYNLTDDSNTQDQSACAYFTQDHKVAAIFTASHVILNQCTENAGALAIDAASAVDFAKYPHLVDPESIQLNRLGAVTTTGLYRSHYFSGKLGLVTWDDPSYRAAISKGYLPTLARYGIKVWQTAYISVPQNFGAIGDMSAAVSSAVTKFRTLGIDHVIVQDGPAGVWTGAGLTLEWMDQAKSQHYYPRYGQNLDNAPGFEALPADEMNNAIAVDQSDYDVKYDKGWHPNPQRQQCFKIEADAGYPVSSGNTNDEGIAAQICDIIFLLQKAMNGVSLISSDSLVQAVAGLGKSFTSAAVYGTDFFTGRRDGGDMVRNEIYKQSCGCLQFLGKPYWAG